MGVPARLALFAALLLVVLGGAAVAGGVVDPQATETEGADHAGGGAHVAAADHGDRDRRTARTTAALPGLSASQAGLRLTLDRVRLAPSAAAEVVLRLTDDAGRPADDLEVAHGKRLHVVVVRRDTKGFQHLHPEQADDGSWRTRADLRRPGSYRVFADVTRGGEQQTLGTDLHVPGTFDPVAIPAPADEVLDDRGLTVRRRASGDAVAFEVLRDGRAVDGELEPHLGAKGHLVTLRVGDLAYLHTHPEGDRLAFGVDLPTAGTYRSWVQFRLDGRVHTAAFTQEESR